MVKQSLSFGNYSRVQKIQRSLFHVPKGPKYIFLPFFFSLFEGLLVDNEWEKQLLREISSTKRFFLLFFISRGGGKYNRLLWANRKDKTTLSGAIKIITMIEKYKSFSPHNIDPQIYRHVTWDIQTHNQIFFRKIIMKYLQYRRYSNVKKCISKKKKKKEKEKAK